MSEFWNYFKLGLEHVLDWNAHYNILFLIILAAAFSFTYWKKVLALAGILTLAYTVALFLSAYGVVTVSNRWMELLIAVTIMLLALHNIFKAKKKESQKNMNLLYFGSAFFGILLGLDTASEMRRAFPTEKFLPLLEFSLGIGAAQIIVVLVVMILAFIAQNFFRVARRDWILVVSAIVIGIILPILRENLRAFF